MSLGSVYTLGGRGEEEEMRMEKWRSVKWQRVGERAKKCNTPLIGMILRLLWNIVRTDISSWSST